MLGGEIFVQEKHKVAAFASFILPLIACVYVSALNKLEAFHQLET
jgi:hypothetical protein